MKNTIITSVNILAVLQGFSKQFRFDEKMLGDSFARQNGKIYGSTGISVVPFCNLPKRTISQF